MEVIFDPTASFTREGWESSGFQIGTDWDSFPRDAPEKVFDLRRGLNSPNEFMPVQRLIICLCR